MIGAFSSERKAAVVMDKEERWYTQKKNNMDTQHRQTGRDQALPHEAPESNPSQKNQKTEGRRSETEKTGSQVSNR